MPNALIIRQGTQVTLHLWERILTTWHCSSVALETIVHMITVTQYPEFLKSRTNYACTARGQNTCYVHRGIIRALNTLHVINPSVRIRLTKTNTQSLIAIITHYMGRGQPPVLSTSITSPLAYEAHRWSSSNVWLSMWRKVEQVWYLKSISTGIMNMVISSARQQAASRQHMQM